MTIEETSNAVVVTIDDPKAYTKPWSVRVNWRLAADEDLIEFICQENNVDEKFLK